MYSLIDISSMTSINQICFFVGKKIVCIAMAIIGKLKHCTIYFYRFCWYDDFHNQKNKSGDLEINLSDCNAENLTFYMKL